MAFNLSMAEILIYIQEKRRLIKKLKHGLFKNKLDKGAYNKTHSFLQNFPIPQGLIFTIPKCLLLAVAYISKYYDIYQYFLIYQL